MAATTETQCFFRADGTFACSASKPLPVVITAPAPEVTGDTRVVEGFADASASVTQLTEDSRLAINNASAAIQHADTTWSTNESSWATQKTTQESSLAAVAESRTKLNSAVSGSASVLADVKTPS
jgi:hypothetical protein